MNHLPFFAAFSLSLLIVGLLLIDYARDLPRPSWQGYFGGLCSLLGVIFMTIAALAALA